MRILAIDPGLRSGWALWTDGSPAASGATKITKTDEELWHLGQELLDGCGPVDFCVIESQYVKHPKAAISIAKSAQTWACLAWDYGASVTWVEPSVWQAALNLPTAAARNREFLAAAYKQRAEMIKGKPIKTLDEAAAIMIGSWASQEART